jgi:hypothetical protein
MLRQQNSYKCTISVVKAPSYPPTSNLSFYMHTKRVLTPPKSPSTLEVLQLPYTVKLWQFEGAPNGVKGPAFTKITPNGRVPALEDPNAGVTSWESGAVINYLLRVYDKQNILGPNPASE